MSDEPIEIELSNTIEPRMAEALDIENSYEFQALVEDLTIRAENGESLPNLVARAVMTLFQPGFVLIGSPNMSPTEDGFLVPDDVGICLSTKSDLTPSGLALLLISMGTAINRDVDDNIEDLRDENDGN